MVSLEKVLKTAGWTIFHILFICLSCNIPTIVLAIYITLMSWPLILFLLIPTIMFLVIYFHFISNVTSNIYKLDYNTDLWQVLPLFMAILTFAGFLIIIAGVVASFHLHCNIIMVLLYHSERWFDAYQ